MLKEKNPRTRNIPYGIKIAFGNGENKPHTVTRILIPAQLADD